MQEYLPKILIAAVVIAAAAWGLGYLEIPGVPPASDIIAKFKDGGSSEGSGDSRGGGQRSGGGERGRGNDGGYRGGGGGRCDPFGCGVLR